MPTFIDFRDGRGGYVCARMGWDISSLLTWAAFTRYVHTLPGRVDMLKEAMQAAREMSPTERLVAAAALAAADFTQQAVDLGENDAFWWRARNLDAAGALAVSATLMRMDAR